jgi:hypothetical protein
VDPRLLAWCDRNGLKITSGRGGVHNKGSKHGRGLAVDVRSRGLTDAFVEHLKRDAEQHGLLVRDERVRPKGQKIWNGEHLHCEVKG